jgi:hypothetical protein
LLSAAEAADLESDVGLPLFDEPLEQGLDGRRRRHLLPRFLCQVPSGLEPAGADARARFRTARLSVSAFSQAEGRNDFRGQTDDRAIAGADVVQIGREGSSALAIICSWSIAPLVRAEICLAFSIQSGIFAGYRREE